MKRDIQTLNKEEIEDLYYRLLLFAAKRLRRVSFRFSKTPDDFVHGAIEKHLDGSRHWNTTKYDLFEHLCGIISSEVSNMIQSHDNKNTYSREDYPDDSAMDLIDPTSSAEAETVQRDQVRKFIAEIARHDLELAHFLQQMINLIWPLEPGDDGHRGAGPALPPSTRRRLMRKLRQYADRFNAMNSKETSDVGK